MFDARLRPLIDRGLNPPGRWLMGLGVSANHVTIAGAFFGLLAFIFVAIDLSFFALWLIILNRIADGLDGAVARAAGQTDFGGYLDLVADFVFYSAIPLAFAIADPLARFTAVNQPHVRRAECAGRRCCGRRAALVAACLRLHNFCIDRRIEDPQLPTYGNMTEVQPQRLRKTPVFDREGRPVAFLDTRLREDEMGNRPHHRHQASCTRRDLLVQAVVDSGLARPPPRRKDAVVKTKKKRGGKKK